MPSRPLSGVAVLVLACLVLVGCTNQNQTKSRAGATVVPTSRAKAPAAALKQKQELDHSPEAQERRAEALAHYGAAVIHDLNDESERVGDELRQAALMDPANDELVLEVTRRLIQLKENEKAVEVLTNATQRADAPGILFARLGLVYALLGKEDLAIAANQKAIEKMPDSIVGYQNLARIYLQGNRQTEGLKLLDEAAQVPSADAGFLVDLSELYAAFSRASVTNSKAAKTKALNLLSRAAELNPTNPMLMQKLADGFALMNEPEQALTWYSKLLERFPNLPGLREKLADVYLRQKDHTNAATQLKAVIRQSPTNPQAYYLLGNLAFEMRNMPEAAENFRKALLLNPNLQPAYYDLALAQINMKQAREALTTLEQAGTKFPQSFAGEFFAGLAYASLKEYSNAVSHFVAAEVIARATDTNRLTHLFYFQLGAAYERNQQWGEAEMNLRKAVQLAPDFSEAYNYLGYMWADRGTNLVEARTFIEKALKTEPENPAYMDSMAWVLYRQGQHQEALTWQLKAIEKETEPDPTLFDHLGDIYAALKQADKAVEAWRKALALEPNPAIEKKVQGAGFHSAVEKP